MNPATPDKLAGANISSLWLSDWVKPEGRGGDTETNQRFIVKSESTLKQVEADCGMIFWEENLTNTP